MGPMVELPSNLRNCTLGDVLGLLHRHGVSGALALHEPVSSQARSHTIHWFDGLVQDIDTPLPVTPFRELLSALASVRASRAPRIDRDVLLSALERQRLERLEALFRVREARLSFSAMGRARRALVPLGPREFLHGRPRARDARERRAKASFTRPPGAAPPEAAEAFDRDSALAALGLLAGADACQIRSAFRQLARRLHPDAHPSASETERQALARRFARITAAYHALDV